MPSAEPQHQLKYLPIDSLVPNLWNTQTMDEATFARLLDEVKESGCTVPLQVVGLKDGTYRIIGGEHRWKACQAAGLEQVPCTILTGKRWEDEDLQKLSTVRLNAIHGKIDSEKFLKLYEQMAEKYGKDAMQTLMGFTDTRAFQKLIGGLKRSMKASLPKEAQGEFESKAKEARSVEDLTTILQTLFAKYGDTLQQSFMIFTYGKAEHVYVQMNPKMKRALDRVINYARETNTDLVEFFLPVLEEAATKATKALKKKPADEKSEKPLDADDV